MKRIEKYKITSDLTIRDAIRRMDKGGIGFSVCVDNNDKVVGVLSDGDFRRAVLDGINLNNLVEKIINKKFKYIEKNYTKEEVTEIFSGDMGRHIPVLIDGKLVDIITEEKFFGIKSNAKRRVMNNWVVIMAGGKGERLDPFTRVLPKALIPIGEKPMIRVIMESFGKFGMKKFTIAINEKGDMIKAYFNDSDFGYCINYIEEEKFLGTAGSLKYLEGKMQTSFFVSNCDIAISADYGEILDFHQEGGYILTLVGSMQRYTIPYGVCDFNSKGVLEGIREKPHYDFLVNTGLYLLEPSILEFIPTNRFFQMTDLIKQAQDNRLKVGVFPVSERAWSDVGQWSEFKEYVGKQGN